MNLFFRLHPSSFYLPQRFDPFGGLVERSTLNVQTAYGFAGEEQDPTTGQLFLRARTYNPATGEILKVTVEAEAEAEKETSTLDTHTESGDNDQAQLNSGADDEHRPTFQPSNPPTLQLTPDHPIYVEGKGWLWAENLALGDRLRRSDGGMAKVLAVERVKLAEPELVYNFTVKGPHTYFVLEVGVLVHNAGCGPDGLGLLERYKRNQWGQAGYDVNNPAIQRFIEKGYYPRDVPTNLAKNLEASAVGREASGFRQWVEQVQNPAISNARKLPKEWEYQGRPEGFYNSLKAADKLMLQRMGYNGFEDPRLFQVPTLEEVIAKKRVQERVDYLYAIDLEGNIRLATLDELHIYEHHSMLVKGENVYGAGTISFRKGRSDDWVVHKVDPGSGHYQEPNFVEVLGETHPISFGAQFKDYLQRRLKEHNLVIDPHAFDDPWWR